MSFYDGVRTIIDGKELSFAITDSNRTVDTVALCLSLTTNLLASASIVFTTWCFFFLLTCCIMLLTCSQATDSRDSGDPNACGTTHLPSRPHPHRNSSGVLLRPGLSYCVFGHSHSPVIDWRHHLEWISRRPEHPLRTLSHNPHNHHRKRESVRKSDGKNINEGATSRYNGTGAQCRVDYRPPLSFNVRIVTD